MSGRAPSFQLRDGRAWHEFLFDWHSILKYFWSWSLYSSHGRSLGQRFWSDLDTHGDAHSSPNAETCHSTSCSEAAHCVDQGDQYSRTTCSWGSTSQWRRRRPCKLVPMGWPRAIEPPLTFTFAGSTPSSFTWDLENIFLISPRISWYYSPRQGTGRQRPHWVPRVRLGQQSNRLLPEQLSLPGLDRCPSERDQHLPSKDSGLRIQD